jgi:hypothetical protein
MVHTGQLQGLLLAARSAAARKRTTRIRKNPHAGTRKSKTPVVVLDGSSDESSDEDNDKWSPSAGSKRPVGGSTSVPKRSKSGGSPSGGPNESEGDDDHLWELFGAKKSAEKQILEEFEDLARTERRKWGADKINHIPLIPIKGMLVSPSNVNLSPTCSLDLCKEEPTAQCKGCIFQFYVADDKRIKMGNGRDLERCLVEAIAKNKPTTAKWTRFNSVASSTHSYSAVFTRKRPRVLDGTQWGESGDFLVWDFQQTNNNTGRSLSIEVVFPHAVVVPKLPEPTLDQKFAVEFLPKELNWDPAPPQLKLGGKYYPGCGGVVLNPASSEYKMVKTEFKGLRGIKRVVRLQNFALLQNFSKYRESLQKKLDEEATVTKAAAKKVQSKWGWHGSKTIEGYVNFCTTGPCKAYNTVCVHGEGTYFAEHPSYSLNYASSNLLLVAELALGEGYVDGSSNDKSLPMKPNGVGFYDHFVGQQSCTLWSLPNDHAALPSYIVEYT